MNKKADNILRRLLLPTGREVLESGGGGALGLLDILARVSGKALSPGGRVSKRVGGWLAEELPGISYAASIPIAGSLITNRLGHGESKLMRRIGKIVNPYGEEAESVFGKGLGLREQPGYKKSASFFLEEESLHMKGYKNRLEKYAQEAKIKEANIGGMIIGGLLGGATKYLSNRLVYLRARQKAKAIIEDIKKDDQVVKDANPSLLDEAAEILATYAPSICSNKNIVRPFLHSFIMSNGNIDISSVAQLAKLQKDFSGV